MQCSGKPKDMGIVCCLVQWHGTVFAGKTFKHVRYVVGGKHCLEQDQGKAKSYRHCIEIYCLTRFFN